MQGQTDSPNTSAEADAAKEAHERMQGVKPPEPEVMGAGAGGPYPGDPEGNASDPYPGDPDNEQLPDGERRFVAPAYRGGKFLAKAGTIVEVPSPRGPWFKERKGDVWVDFAAGNGIFRTTDPVAIAWCEAHSEVCRDAFDPKTPAWVALKEATLETATQGARLPRNTDIDAMLRGDAAGLGGSDLVKQARGT